MNYKAKLNGQEYTCTTALVPKNHIDEAEFVFTNPYRRVRRDDQGLFVKVGDTRQEVTVEVA